MSRCFCFSLSPSRTAALILMFCFWTAGSSHEDYNLEVLATDSLHGLVLCGVYSHLLLPHEIGDVMFSSPCLQSHSGIGGVPLDFEMPPLLMRSMIRVFSRQHPPWTLMIEVLFIPPPPLGQWGCYFFSLSSLKSFTTALAEFLWILVCFFFSWGL